jgi:fatty acid CoA ligase FadD9
LLIRTRTIIPGYYKRPEVTAEVFDEGGYYRTGDIMAEIGPDELVYVDRRWSGTFSSTAAAKAPICSRIRKDAGLNSYEIPRDFLIECVPFSTKNSPTI